MALIESHYTMNIARDGWHYARVEFPTTLTREETQRRAESIAVALGAASPTLNWSFKLTHVVCSGLDVAIEVETP